MSATGRLFVVVRIMACAAFVPASHAQQAKPNVIYIFADDLGYGELGAYGQQKIKTPHLDQMAREGMRFTQHYTSTPVCAPSRCMLLTGKHGGRSYIRGNYEMGGFADSLEGGQMPLPMGIPTLPRLLKEAGYATGMVGKWGLGMHFTSGSPLRHGFDYYFGYLDQKQAHNYYPSHLWENDQWVPLDNPYMDVHTKLDSIHARDVDFNAFTGNAYAPELMTEKALRFIESNRSQPFFLYLPFTIPHVSLQAPEAYIDLYREEFDDTPYYGQHGYTPCLYPRATYAAMITYLDAQVGKIMDKIKALGLDENTVILFSSDNGTTFNGGVDHAFFNSVAGLRGMKMDVFEGGIRVPFIARWPQKIPAETISDLPSAQYDLMATLAELIGEEVEDTDGVSFLPTLLGKYDQQREREYLYFEYPEKGGQIAIRTGKWKGVKLSVRKKGDDAKWMLFDLNNDRNETTDVAARFPEITSRFDEIVAEAHQNSHIREWEFINPKFEVR